jgi:hypothetical protein
VSVQLHASAALPRGKIKSVPIQYETVLGSSAGLDALEKGLRFSHVGNRTAVYKLLAPYPCCCNYFSVRAHV